MAGLLGPLVAALIVTERWTAVRACAGCGGVSSGGGRVGGGSRFRSSSVPARSDGWRRATTSRAPTLRHSGIGTSLGAFATVAVVFACNGLGEETGWQGFAVARLLQTQCLTATSLLVAAVRALWHLPLFFTLESSNLFTVVEIFGWVIGITAASFLLTWLFRGSGGSVLLVGVRHTAFNFTSGATPAGSGAVAAVTSTLVMIATVLIVIGERRSGRSKPVLVRPLGSRR